MKHSFIAKKLPFFRFEDHAMVYLDGSLGVGFRLRGCDISCASPEEINSFCQKIENFLVGLPEKLRLQVFYRLTNSVQNTLAEHKEASAGSDARYQPIREARFEFLDKKIKEKNFFVPEVYVFVRSAPLQLKKRRFFEKEQEFQGYLVAYLGFFVATALTHFVWTILYVASPLMILMYVSRVTAYVTMSLYKGLIQVVVWKVLWSILGVLLLKLAVQPQVSGMEDYLMSIVLNLCIGFSMLFIPLATRSLISDGMNSVATTLAAAPTLAAGAAVKTVFYNRERQEKDFRY